MVESYDQAWRLLDVSAEVATFEGILALVRDDPTALDWVLGKPHAALAVGGE